MDEPAAIFERDRYVVLRSLLPEPQARLMYRYAGMAIDAGLTENGDSQVAGSPCRYGDPTMEGLLVTMLPEVERACGLSALPTYSYFRVYKRGDSLKRHTDRPSCEISLSVCLGYEAAEPWPIWIEGPGGATSVSLEPGDGVLYRGIECPHWRSEFQGERLVQVFLHYVDQNGPNSAWKFDKRESLATVQRGGTRTLRV